MVFAEWYVDPEENVVEIVLATMQTFSPFHIQQFYDLPNCLKNIFRADAVIRQKH